jgi:hypothetical protein
MLLGALQGPAFLQSVLQEAGTVSTGTCALPHRTARFVWLRQLPLLLPATAAAAAALAGLSARQQLLVLLLVLLAVVLVELRFRCRRSRLMGLPASQ